MIIKKLSLKCIKLFGLDSTAKTLIRIDFFDETKCLNKKSFSEIPGKQNLKKKNNVQFSTTKRKSLLTAYIKKSLKKPAAIAMFYVIR